MVKHLEHLELLVIKHPGLSWGVKLLLVFLTQTHGIPDHFFSSGSLCFISFLFFFFSFISLQFEGADLKHGVRDTECRLPVYWNSESCMISAMTANIIHFIVQWINII